MNATSTIASVPATINGDADCLYEVVNGQILKLPPMGAYQILIASDLMRHLGNFAEKHALGRAVAEMLFLLDRTTDLQRRPDVAVVSYRRWPRERKVPTSNAWEVVPDLAVEIVSPTNTADAILAKIREYFQAGVTRVWVVYPTEQQVYVYESPVHNRILTPSDELEAEDVLPGFRLRVAALFDGEEASR
jgi:Uma2 family endonuclease